MPKRLHFWYRLKVLLTTSSTFTACHHFLWLAQFLVHGSVTQAEVTQSMWGQFSFAAFLFIMHISLSWDTGGIAAPPTDDLGSSFLHFIVWGRRYSITETSGRCSLWKSEAIVVVHWTSMVLGNVCLKCRLRLVVAVAFWGMGMWMHSKVCTETQCTRSLTTTHPCKNTEFLQFLSHLPPS